MDNFLLILEQQRLDILFAIKLRKASRRTKYRLISTTCSCCLKRIIRNTYMLSDQELSNEVANLNDTIESLLSNINIKQLL